MLLRSAMNRWVLAVLAISAVISLIRNPRGETEKSFSHEHFTSLTESASSVFLASSYPSLRNLEYDFYRNTCPDAEKIIKSKMAEIYSEHKNVSAAFLRLLFHDCFIQRCDASILLEDIRSTRNNAIEKTAIPSKTLRGFDKIDSIKQEIENVCPGIVSCADILSLATRDGIVLAGGPFYPVFTGRRDSTRSFYEEAMAEIPKPDDDINRTLYLFGRRGFTEREIVSLLGGHNIGKIGCEFIEKRLYNFSGTGRPDPSIAPEFLEQIRLSCQASNDDTNETSRAQVTSIKMGEPSTGMSYFQKLASSMLSGESFNTHYYQSLLRGRGLLFADQQLMANEKTAELVRAYASDNGFTFRLDFAKAMIKMSSLNVLTGSQGEVRLNCSLLAH